MTNVRVKYIGTIDRFSEVGITGQQQVWQRGEAGFVSDANAVLLVASGQFVVAEVQRAQLVIDASGGTAGILDPATGATIDLHGGGGGGAALPTISAQTSVSVSITATAAPATSSAFTAFPAQACTELVIANRTGVEIEYTRNGTTYMSIKPGVTRRIVGITDASQIAVRRSDWNDLTLNTTRTSTVTATAITSTEAFTGAAILNVSVTNGGGGNGPAAYACTGAEIVNNTNKDMQYRVSPATAFVRIPAGGSELVFGLTNTSQILFQPYDNVSDAARPVMIEAFTSGLRERLNQSQPVPLVSANARILLGDMQYPSKQPTGPNLSIAEAARGPRRTLVPSRVIPLAQFNTVSNLTGATAQCTDATDGDLYLGTTQVEFTQSASGTYNFMPPASSVLATGIDVSQGIIRITMSLPKGTPDYSTSYSLTALRVQLFSSGSPSSVPADYHQAGLSTGEVIAAKIVSYNKRTCSFSFDISAFAAVGAGANLSAITWARFQLTGGSSGNGAKFRPVSIDYIPKALSKGIVIFTVDDFNTGAWTGLLPMLSKYGYPAVLFGDSFVNLGNSGNLSAEQVRILHQHYGWQVANQNFYRETSTYDNSEQLIQEHSKYALIMQALGISNLEDTSFGTGTWDNFRDDNMPAVRRMFRTATLFMNGANSTPPLPFGETAPFGDPYRIRRLNMSSFNANTALQRFKEHVDQAVTTKGVAIFGAHTEFNPANMANEVATVTPALLDYIRAYELNNQVEVLTMAQAIEKIYPRA